MNTKQGYILYIDILGYTDLLKNSSDDEHEKNKHILEQLTKKYFSLDFSLALGQNYDDKKVFKRFFSDNFLFLYECVKDDFLALLTIQSVASQIQTQLLYCGLLTRGSIIYGEISYTEEIVYGCDLIKAVELEEGHFEPSVWVDEELQSVLVNNQQEYYHHNTLLFSHGHSDLDFEDIKNGIKKCITRLNKMESKEKIIKKLQWVIDRTNEHFSVTQNHLSLSYQSNISLIYKKGETIK